MTMPALPPSGSTDWYAHYAALDARARLGIGEELGYAERTTQDTTTSLPSDNTTLSSNLISGLSATVTGVGRAVEVEFFCGIVVHSVVGGHVYAHLMMDGAQISLANARATASNVGISPMIVKARVVVPQGASRTFTVAKSLDTAGTGTYYADAVTPMYLSVVQR